MNSILLTYLGHACFKIEYDNYSIILDPYKGVPGFNDIEGTCNEVICSHNHFDHCFTDKLNIVKKQSPFIIETIKSFHDDVNGLKRGPNDINIIKVNNKRIVHLGDLGHILDKECINKLKDIDVLLIPIGGTYTIDSDTALKIIDDIKPRIIVPMHYKDKNRGLDVLEDIEDFIKKTNKYKESLRLIRGYNQTIEI